MEDGEWYKILSGSVEGYIKAEFFVTGEDAEAIAREVGYVTATINTETLRLRADADLGSSTLSLLSQGENYEVVSQEGDFTQILVDNDLYGYVSNDYIDEKVEFAEAISIEEERAKQEEEARKQNLDIIVKKLPVMAIPRAKTLGETDGLLKAIIDKKTGLILGCMLFAPDSSEVINTVALAMKTEQDYTFLRDFIFTHPSMSEALNDLFA